MESKSVFKSKEETRKQDWDMKRKIIIKILGGLNYTIKLFPKFKRK